MKQYYDFYYNLSIAYFIADMDCMFMDRSRYMLENTAKGSGKDILVSLVDLEKIYGPYMEITADENNAKIEMNDIIAEVKPGCNKININGKVKEMSAAAEISNGVIFVPVGSFMELAFDKMITYSKDVGLTEREWPRSNHIVAVCDKYEYRLIPGVYRTEAVRREAFKFEQSALTAMNLQIDIKTAGELYYSFWFPMAKKVIPYALYVPVKYDPAKPTKMVVSLHGAGLGEEYIYSLSQNKMQRCCEDHNYIFLAPGACTKGSFYGGLIPPIQTELPEVIEDRANPQNLDDAEITRRSLGEYCVLAAIEEVKRLYNIDDKCVFLMGNSMGSAGTYYLSNKYPEMFRAIAPSGGCLRFDLMDLERWKNMPIRIVGGTEDHHGFLHIQKGYNMLKDAGLNAELAVVGGGVHYDAWAYVLEETFEFFEKNS